MGGHNLGRIHVRTLMRKMGIEAIYKKPHLSKPHPGHKVYPYLLRGLDITQANSVWCADIIYVPMARGSCYLVAVMDWANRKVLSFRLSNTLDTSFCIEALEEALRNYGVPDIFNADQGGSVREGCLLWATLYFEECYSQIDKTEIRPSVRTKQKPNIIPDEQTCPDHLTNFIDNHYSI